MQEVSSAVDSDYGGATLVVATRSFGRKVFNSKL